MEQKRKKMQREEVGEDLLELEVVVDLVDVDEDVVEEAQGDVEELAKILCNVYVQKSFKVIKFFEEYFSEFLKSHYTYMVYKQRFWK